jgi:poly-gamma-glutamate synthesis protein (capsule biosynthesis protein)
VLALVVVTAVVVGAWLAFGRTPVHAITGTVLDLDGRPISGATVQLVGGVVTTSDDHGEFVLTSAANAGWVRVAHAGQLSRTRAARAGDPTVVRLSPDDGRTVRLLFGGDVMFGRRFYDANDDGRTDDGLLPADAGAAAFDRLLAGVKPLLEDADISVVNLETPLMDGPWFDPTTTRPARFHRTKEFAFASAPGAAAALDRAGIDIVGLGNNHVLDGLDAGLESTRTALAAAGFGPDRATGAGADEAAAWHPARMEVRGQAIEVLACTTISGTEHAIPYVAGPGRAGAALCEPDRLAAEVRAARGRADLVVVMIHGGFEYEPEPSARIRSLSAAAHAAGAALVVNHHPHVVGGLDLNGSDLTAWTMGNLLFDQTVWPTFSSYVLRVDVRDGVVADATIEPIMIDDFRPTGVVGARADWVARGALTRSVGPWVLDDGSLRLDLGHRVIETPVTIPVEANGSDVVSLDGACVASTTAPGVVAAVGHDLLWTGDFEDLDVAADVPSGALWNTAPASAARRVISGSDGGGSAFVRLRRSGANDQDVVLSPLHRILVDAGRPLSFLANLRGSATVATLQLSWYNDLKGASVAQTVVDLPVTTGWSTVRLDTDVPANAVAVGLFIRLSPPGAQRVEVDLDDVRMIEWRAPSAAPACEDVLLGPDGGGPALHLVTSALPGLVDRPSPVTIAATLLKADTPPPLPVGLPGLGRPGED